MWNLLNFWGSGEDPQDGEIPSETRAGQGSWLWNQWEQLSKWPIGGSSQKLQCNVQCFGQGDVHEKIVKELDISQCEGPGVPCVLFVYKVSCVIQDLQNVLQSVTGEERARKEDICAVILLVSPRDVAEEMKRKDPESFPEGTEIMPLTDPGLVEDPEGSEIQSVPWTVLHSWFWYLWNRWIIDGSSEKLRCNVRCYGRGDTHEKSVKELDISPCEDPEIPCVLFVYKVSREIEDLRNSLQWVTEKQGMKSKNICAVILLEKCLHKWKIPVEVDHQGTFDTNTVVVRILWDSPEKIQEAMDKVKQSIRRWWGDVWTVIHTAETLDNLYKPVDVAYQAMFNPKTVFVRMLWDSAEKIQEHPCYKEAVDKVKQSIRMWRGLVEDPQGGEIQSVPCTGHHSWFWYLWDRWIIDGSSEKLRCNVRCYGRGDTHEKIMMALDISPCEDPEIPCVLFVYKVSHEIEDLRNSLQWVTEKQGMKSKNICAVILLEKCLHKWKIPVEVDHQGTFDTNTVVVRILWDSPEKIQEAMDKVKQSIRRWWGDVWTVIHTAETLDNLYKPVDVAYQAMFNPKTVFVRMLWDSAEKIQEHPCYKEAVDKVKQSIRMWWDYSKDTSAFTTQ